ncbi:type I methionyl aminopeptidase [Desulfobotulus mexicanus]|uniref:type I methionyl aminopeptidase n=1 Tax=Desulfobotulus mexicanus TaxID=2586642 RepID=UPI0015D30F3C|nr:type I methionyl aminopeptidase [Desulfobotulus mexicanus]
MQLLMKIGRNDPCPCGSGKKYKKCCASRKEPLKVDLNKYYQQTYGVRLKSKEQIEGIRKAGKLVMETHQLVAEYLKSGITTDDVNELVHRHTLKNGGIPAPLNYRGFPKSVCVSPNEVICHGIPGGRVLADGDIVNVDITTILDGYYADANYTYFIGAPSPEARRLVAASLESLRQGLAMVKPGNTTGDIGWAIQRYAEGQGYSVVREFVGHGVGLEFHEGPQILHFGKKGTGVPLVPGMTFTVEPMINIGKKDLYILEDKWTAVTRDGRLSAQFEQTIVVTEDGYESLTPFSLDSFVQAV